MALADLSVETVEQVVVARVDGEIDMSNASELGNTISRQVSNEAAALVLELSDVGYVDSAGIQVIYQLHERLQTRGQQLWLVVPAGSPIAYPLRLADIPGAIAVAETLDGALESLGA